LGGHDNEGFHRRCTGIGHEPAARPCRRNKTLVSQGYLPYASTPEQFAAMVKEDMVKYANIIRTANIKLEE